MAVLGPGSYMSVGGVGEHQGPKEPREPQGGTQGGHREGPKEPGRGTAQGKPREPKGDTGRDQRGHRGGGAKLFHYAPNNSK